ncbi:hypothetical protein SDJN02_12476, partial [Cucurbita argyrosperma subsp. argyrosperma]
MVSVCFTKGVFGPTTHGLSKVTSQVVRFVFVWLTLNIGKIFDLKLLIWLRSGDLQVAPIRPLVGLDECHDATEENGASSNTPNEVGIEDELRHKQDRDIE